MPAGTIPSPSSATSSVPTSTPSSSPTTKSSAAPDFPEGVPAAARKHTKEGAVAFVRHYVSELNAAWRDPDPDRIGRLCLKTSKSCQAFIVAAEELDREGRRYSSDAVRIDRAGPFGEAGKQFRVEFHGGQTGARVVDANGKVVDEESVSTTHNMFFLEWTTSGWMIAAIKDFK
ncbi:hypothetical protein OO014_15780 [Intrasporangium calvum]|uniref:Uncharacterized protein n=2 Tax=Intrasporangium calvum TaxID=53358 RepID=A0ABT5GM21_9MICO|nr:hypothetical protein [Intrasporangium calvum]